MNKAMLAENEYRLYTGSAALEDMGRLYDAYVAMGNPVQAGRVRNAIECR